MNYSDLIDQLSERTGHSKAETKKQVQQAISVLSDQLSAGKGVSIPDLGTFSTHVKDVRKVYSPHHKTYILTPPKRVVDFSPAAGLKEDLKFTEPADE
jgi:DNA-binding protein HU-beta